MVAPSVDTAAAAHVVDIAIKKEPLEPELSPHDLGRPSNLVVGVPFIGLTISASVARISPDARSCHLERELTRRERVCGPVFDAGPPARRSHALARQDAEAPVHGFDRPCTHVPVVGGLPVCEFGGTTWYLQGSPAWAVREICSRTARPKAALKQKKEAEAARAYEVKVNVGDHKEAKEKKTRAEASTLEVKTRLGMFEFRPTSQRIAPPNQPALPKTIKTPVTHYFLVPREATYGIGPMELTRPPLTAAKTKALVDEAKHKLDETSVDMDKRAMTSIPCEEGFRNQV